MATSAPSTSVITSAAVPARGDSPWTAEATALTIAWPKPARTGQTRDREGPNPMIKSLPRKTAAARAGRRPHRAERAPPMPRQLAQSRDCAGLGPVRGGTLYPMLLRRDGTKWLAFARSAEAVFARGGVK
jgi:hypothetical protein